jgi:hypothetical protein
MAPQISRTRKQQSNIPSDPNTLFDPIEHPDIGEDDDNLDPQPDQRVLDLERRLAEFQAQLEETQRANTALLAQAPRAQNFEAPTPVKEKPLPDPAIDPDGFAVAMEERLRNRLEASNRTNYEASRTQRELTDRVEGLWEDFNSTYSDYDQEKVEIAAGKVAEKAKRKGLDVEKYMFVSSDRFFRDTVKEYERLFGAPGEENDEDVDDNDYDDAPRSRKARPASNGKTRNRRDRDDDDRDDGRSASIFGGQESGGRPGKSRKDDEGPSMIDDIHNMQTRTGFY